MLSFESKTCEILTLMVLVFVEVFRFIDLAASIVDLYESIYSLFKEYLWTFFVFPDSIFASC